MNTIQNDKKSRLAHWSGIDTAKKSFDASLVRQGQKFPATKMRAVPVKHFARTEEGAKNFVAWLDGLNAAEQDPCEVRVVMEATGKYSEELAIWLIAARPSLAPAIVNPQQTSKYIGSMGLRNKTDRLDARALGFYGQEREPVPYEPDTPQQSELRALSRWRGSLVERKVALENQANESTASKLAEKMQARQIRQLKKDIARVEKDMRRIVSAHEELRNDVKLWSTIYGVAFITAATIRAELGDLRRFHKARQLSAFVGLNPRNFTSGTSVHGCTRLSKQGNSRARSALYMAAVTVIRGRSDLQETYCRLIDAGKTEMAALGAVMRKLLLIMRAMLIEEKDYDPWWKTSGKTCADAK